MDLHGKGSNMNILKVTIMVLYYLAHNSMMIFCFNALYKRNPSSAESQCHS